MALVAGLNTLASGTGVWTIGEPPGSAIAIDDPGMVGQVPTAALALNLNSNAPSTLTFTGDATTIAPSPVDSIGFTANVQLTVVNDTGKALNGVLLTLANDDPNLPLSLVPGVIQFGHTVNANYAFFTDIQPVAGMTMSLFSPDGKATTPTGAAASSIALSGSIPVGGSITESMVVHNTELSVGNNNFVMNVSPT
jgi:hypothetical protein